MPAIALRASYRKKGGSGDMHRQSWLTASRSESPVHVARFGPEFDNLSVSECAATWRMVKSGKKIVPMPSMRSSAEVGAARIERAPIHRRNIPLFFFGALSGLLGLTIYFLG